MRTPTPHPTRPSLEEKEDADGVGGVISSSPVDAAETRSLYLPPVNGDRGMGVGSSHGQVAVSKAITSMCAFGMSYLILRFPFEMLSRAAPLAPSPAWP